MRPVYWTPGDKSREAAIVAELGRAWGWQFTPFPALSPVDWLAHRDGGKVCAVVEVKARTFMPGAYPTLMLSAHKWVAVRDVAHGFHVPALLVLGLGDGSIHWTDLADAAVDTVSVGGRRDRGDPGDIEPCVFLRLDDQMQRLKGT